MDLSAKAAFHLGVFRVAPPTCVVSWPGGEAVLQPRVMQVLVTLAQAEGAVVSRDALINACWDGRVVGEDAITRVIVHLRRLAQRVDSGGFRLETIPRVGYRLAPTDASGAPIEVARGGMVGRRGLLAAGGAVAVAGAAGAALLRDRWPRPLAEPLTLAVLPFSNLSADGGGDYLSLGVARSVRDALSRVGGLRVIADTSSFPLASRKLSMAEVARRLGAQLLLTGAVTVDAGAVRISQELIDPLTQVQVWTDVQSGRLDDLFRLLDEASAAALGGLAGRIGPDRLRAPPALRPRDPAAFHKVLEADGLMEQSRTLRMVARDAEGYDAADRAWDLAQDALRIDPGDVGALLVVASLTRNGWTRALAAQPASVAERAAEAADLIRRALISDPNDPGALTALGDYYRRFEWRWDEAENLFRRALAGNPSLTEAHWAYGYELGELGRAKEGLAHAREVFRLDPENPFRRVALPRLLYLTGQREAALRSYDAELAANPANAFLIREIYLMHLAEANLGALGRLRGRLTQDLWRGRPIPGPIAALLARMDAAIAALRGAPERLVGLVDADLAAYDSAGRAEAATQQGRASVDMLFIYAMEYAWAGATRRAFDVLARALAARSLYWVASLPYGPAEFPAAMRGDPRYAALWGSEPRLAQLVRSRRAALARGQMARPFARGRDWDG